MAPIAWESHSIFCSPLGALKTDGLVDVVMAGEEPEAAWGAVLFCEVVPELQAARTTSKIGRRRFTLFSVATSRHIDSSINTNFASTLRK
jgi:hypothetical protein